MFTRQHYKAITEVLREARSRSQSYGTGCVRDIDTAGDVLDEVTARLCELFRADNPRFNRDRFERAAHADRREYGRLTRGEDVD